MGEAAGLQGKGRAVSDDIFGMGREEEGGEKYLEAIDWQGSKNYRVRCRI